MVVHIAGAGAAGTSVGQALRLAGRPLGLVACRTLERAVQRCQLIGGGTPTTLELLAADPAGAPCLLLIAVPDRSIQSTATDLAGRPWPADSVALHLSGSVPVEALGPLRGAGLSVGSLHPLKSFVDAKQAANDMATDAPLRDIVCALEGDAPALTAAQALVAEVGARSFVLAPGGRAAWHAGAAHACNHLVALVDQALDLFEVAGLDRETARAALWPLLSGTVDNLRDHAPGHALTGPVVRGDADVVAGHMEVLKAASPDLVSAYRALAWRALDLARAERGLDETLAARIDAALNGGQE